MIQWIMNSRIAQWVSLAIFALLAIIGFGASKKREGKKEVWDDAKDGARKRKDERDEIEDEITHAGGAADRLHDKWSRD